MKIPKALSPSSLRLFKKDRNDFYLEKLADRRAPKQLQPQFMAIGSGFDARAKSQLHHDLGGSDPQFDFKAIFELQVESQNRDWTLDHSEYLFAMYRESGAYDRLLKLLQSSSSVRFEFDVTKTIGGVPMTGKPDLKFVLDGRPIILDWKVKGYMSQASPSKCYVDCCGKSHKGCAIAEWNGLAIHAGSLADSDPKYADQLAMYSWLEGEPIGNECLFWIEELVSNAKRKIRVAMHRAIVSRSYQLQLLADAQECWQAITSGHYFWEMTRDESIARCAVLEDTARYMHVCTL